MSSSVANNDAIIRSGYLKKLKTSKKKYFVLRAETCETSARLEYYDSLKKFSSGQQAKRSIPLKTCFNINKRSDTKHKHVIALYTKDDCFCVVLDSEEELDSWLKALLSQQQGEEVPEGEVPRPTFEHVWQIMLLNRGLGAGYNKTSDPSRYRLCLTDKTLSLIRKDFNEPHVELSLSSIRSCGSLKNFFFLEAGRSSAIGAGELWMETEDGNIAQNVHQTVFHAMTSNSSSSREELAPTVRIRSSSATESSKPNNMVRRQTLTGTPKPVVYQHQDHTSNVNEHPVAPCTSTNNTTAGNVAWPGTVNHQRTRSLPLAHPAPITNTTTTTSTTITTTNTTNTTTEHPLHPPRAVKRPTNQSSKCFNNDCRLRCDSMPSRPRTTSEGNHNHHHPVQNASIWDKAASFYGMYHRPQSFLGRDISHSPPSGSPVSPPSATGSTDSAGSSLSIDENEPWHEDVHRRGFPTSLTPDEAIAEENCDDCTDSPCMVHSSPIPSTYVPMAPISSDDGYVDMSPRGRHNNMSPAASMSSVTSGTPSTDMRFSEYQLEKVSSCFTPSEEEETSSAERPRTYSMGSKPYKSRFEQQARDRAWSVGSKRKTNNHRVLPPHGSHIHQGPKSSSAPMLSNSRLHSSHSSIDPMEDLMEMDFTRNNNNNNNIKNVHNYMDMKLGSKTPSGYVEMRPGVIEKPIDTSPYVDMRPPNSTACPVRSDYMDMDPRRNNRNKPLSTSPKNPSISVSPHSSIASTSPCYSCKYDYMDMSSRNVNYNHDTHVISPVKSVLSGYPNGSPSTSGYMDMDFHPDARRDTPESSSDDYMEMKFGSSRTSDYTNMSFGSKSKPKKEATRSQPITIQNAPSTKGSSPVYKKLYLPIFNTSHGSLPRQRSRKNSRRDSKDSSSSSVTTPSSSSTMFPLSLNSPSSPVYTPNAKSPETGKSMIKIPISIINAKYTQSTKGFCKDGYASMDFGSRPKDTSEYVNFNPADNSSTGDYAVMQPGNNLEMCFKPISDNCEDGDGKKQSRPESVGSEAKLSRPSSESSEVSSDTSTVVGSRPSSVSVEKPHPLELHYASLDLIDDDCSKSPRTTGKSQQSQEAQTSTFTAGPSTSSARSPDFTYAEIDFIKSDGLKSSQLLNNAKIQN